MTKFTKLFGISLILLFLVTFVSCAKKTPVSISSVSSMTLEVNESKDLTIEVVENKKNSESAIRKALEYKVDDPKVVKVENGKVTALAPGNATITVTWTKDTTVKTTTKVEVAAPNVATITIDAPETVKNHSTTKLTYTCENATSATWQTSDSTIATIDESGNLKALKTGSVAVTLTVSNGYKTKTQTVFVTILDQVSSITYTLNEGVNGANPAVYVEGEEVELKPATREGYSFDGWFLNDQLITKIESTQRGDITLVAKFTYIPKVYNITYQLNEGTNGENPDKYTEFEEVELKPATREGYNFDGWFLNDQLITKIENTQKGDITLVAKFTYIPKVYNITYQLNEGTNGENPDKYTEFEEVELKPATREGYSFDGWFLNDQLITKIENTQKGDITLVAKFTLIPTNNVVTYELNGGSWSWTTGTVSTPKNGINSVSNLPEVFMGDFYQYLKENDLLESSIVDAGIRAKAESFESFSKSYTDPVALYNHTSTLGYNRSDGYSQFFYNKLENDQPVGGFFGTSPYKEKYANLFNIVLQMAKIKYTTLDYATDSAGKSGFGFVFDGYFYGTQGLMSGTNSETFNALRGVIPTPTKTYNGTQEVTNVYNVSEFELNTTLQLVAPTKEGFAFLGWYKTADFSGDAVTSITESATLYAKWFDLNAPIPTYEIEYKLNGGTNPADAPTSYKEGKGVATLPTPTKDRHRFLGWSLNSASTNYVTSISKTQTGKVVLVANFEEVTEIRITYVYEDGDTPVHTAKDFNEFAATFWQEFYEWSGQTVGVDAFKAAALKQWGSYSPGNYKLYKLNGEDEIDPAYFVHTKGNEKWMEWMKLFEAIVKEINPSQTAWGSNYVGYMRVYQFFTQGSNYNADRTKRLSEAYPIHDKLVQSFKPGDDITLVGLVVDDGRDFLGWYDQNNNLVTTTKNITEDITLTAKWSASTPIESFSVTNQITKMVRLSTYQLEWAFNPTNATNKKLTFKSSNPAIISIDEEGLMTSHKDGTATITVEVKEDAKFNVSFDVTVYVDTYIDIAFDGHSWIEPTKTTKLSSVIKSGTGTVKYRSLNPNIATVDDAGVVTGVEAGYANIEAYIEGNESIKITIGVTVTSTSMETIMNVIRNAHNEEIYLKKDLHVAYAYYTDVFNSVSDLLFNYNYKVDESLVQAVSSSAKKTGRPGTKITNMEFITIHYTAGVPESSNARATASYFAGTTAASANFCTGNDGIYMSVPDGEVSWHAGDGTTVPFFWTNTGVKATENVKPIWGVVKSSQSSTGYFFTLNGQATTISVPIEGKTSSGAAATIKDPANAFSYYGPAWKVVDGYYYMGNTWACFTQKLSGVISSRGGNLNSVGIETACNMKSDLWYTYQITAQLVARLLSKYNLDTTRVVGHNMFSGKDCPQTLLANHGELWELFMECVEAENALYKLGSDYTVTAKSNNPDILSDNGRIIELPKYTTSVSYTVTVKNNATGDVTTETYSTVVKGIYSR